MPGVRAVLTGADLNAGARHACSRRMWAAASNPPGPCAPVQPLADADVRFVGDPIAIVVAESRYLAEDACELVEVEYEPLDADRRLRDRAPTPRSWCIPSWAPTSRSTSGPHRIPSSRRSSSPLRTSVTETLRQHRHTNVPMETRGVVATFTPASGELDVSISTQNPARGAPGVLAVPRRARALRAGVAAPTSAAGSARSTSCNATSSSVIAAAHTLGRHGEVDRGPAREPDRVEPRPRRLRDRARWPSTTTGTILGAHFDHLEDCGACPSAAPAARVPFVGDAVPRPVPASRGWAGRTRSVWTNTCGRGAYRGPWMFETVAREQMVDLVAREIGHRPARAAPAQRRARPRSCRITTPTGMPLDHVTPSETLEQAVDHHRLRRVPRRAAPRVRRARVGCSASASACTSSRRAMRSGTARRRDRDRARAAERHGRRVPRHRVRTGRASRRRWPRSSPSDLGVDYRRRRRRAGRHRAARRSAAAPAAAAPRSIARRRGARGARDGARRRRSRSPRTCWRPRPTTSRSSDGAIAGAGHAGARRRARRGRARPRITSPRACRRAMEPGLEATASLPGAADHVVERVPRVHGRGRPRHRRSSRSCATS